MPKTKRKALEVVVKFTVDDVLDANPDWTQVQAEEFFYENMVALDDHVTMLGSEWLRGCAQGYECQMRDREAAQGEN